MSCFRCNKIWSALSGNFSLRRSADNDLNSANSGIDIWPRAFLRINSLNRIPFCAVHPSRCFDSKIKLELLMSEICDTATVELEKKTNSTVCFMPEDIPPIALIINADPTATDTLVLTLFIRDKAPQEMLFAIQYRIEVMPIPMFEMADWVLLPNDPQGRPLNNSRNKSLRACLPNLSNE